ncbi:hypothetical protein LZP73_13980 [Shewanella sp. AS16]|uniref:hypothetical protein n=1 Tax=Shewanella sp. AS16 TaxID=2907625 RepID=UPI001F219C31|nr:hypothetical protein [Shewanella sp. AS16]MCE9687300.1 hypothetical protein [Shewanella sp. AS16]
MKTFLNALTLATMLALPASGVAQDDANAGTPCNMSQEQVMAMQQHMQGMQALMHQIQQEKNPKHHAELMQQHMNGLMKGMQMMNGGQGGMSMMNDGKGGMQMMHDAKKGQMMNGEQTMPMNMDERLHMMELRMGMMQQMMQQMLEHSSEK